MLLLLSAPLLTLVSLYLPWQNASCADRAIDHFDPVPPVAPGPGPDLFISSCGSPIDGWSSVGEVAALSAVLLVALAALALIRPRLAERLPLGQAAAALAFFTAAVVAQTHLEGGEASDTSFHLAYGTVVGVAAGLVALAAAGVLRRDELSFMPPARRLAVARRGRGAAPRAAAAVGADGHRGTADRGEPARVPRRRRRAGRARRDRDAALPGRPVPRATAHSCPPRRCSLFVIGTIAYSRALDERYGAWIGLVLAAAALVLTLVERPWRSFALRPSWLALGTACGLGLLAVSLSLPWQRGCYPEGALAQVGLSGRCLSRNGWELDTSVGLLLAVGLAGVVLALALRELSRTELAVGLALMIATAGFRLETGEYRGVQFEVAYGAIIGFAAAALLVGLALAGVRVHGLDWSRRATAVPAVAARRRLRHGRRAAVVERASDGRLVDVRGRPRADCAG